MTEEERAEAFREFHADHLRRQTSAIETIKTFVLIWFWLTVAGAFLIVVTSAVSASRF